jgi:hypothetical protein
VKRPGIWRVFQPSVSRTKHPSALFPSSELLGYYHSSALRTDKPISWPAVSKARGQTVFRL